MKTGCFCLFFLSSQFTPGQKGSQLQKRIRGVLITALQNIDLQDENTLNCLESALSFIQGLLDQVDLVSPTAATRQWRQLASLIRGGNLREDDTKTSGRQKRVPRADCSGVLDGAYHPNKRVKGRAAKKSASALPCFVQVSRVFWHLHTRFVSTALLTGFPTVFQGDNAIQLQCSSCPATISSSWFFRHPGSGQVHVLVPEKGHYACKKRLGNTSPWIPASGVPSKLDRYDFLNFCHHMRESRYCKLCGGRNICEHQKIRHSCGTCRKLARQRAEEKVSIIASFRHRLDLIPC